MEPWQSWAVVGALGVGGYLYYARSQKSSRGRGQRPSAATVSQSRRRSSVSRDESRGRKKKGKGKAANGGGQKPNDVASASSASAPASGTEKATKKKGGKKQPSNLGQSSAIEVEAAQAKGSAFDEPEDEAMDNKEFAKQMSGLKTGSSLQKPDGTGETKKTRKQGKQNETRQAPVKGKALEPARGAKSPEMSTTSSTTGADADDDLSPVASPGLGASQATPNAGGVADMLEAPAKGPSVLRLTQPTQPQPERQQKPKKETAEVESKKQRQNRKKNEEKRVAREEAEKERRVLLEKQRRTAREAEGRPAKNGLGTMPPTTNAWSNPAAATSSNAPSNKAPANVNGSLLDTFDESSKSANDSSNNATKGSNGSTVSNIGTNGVATNRKHWEKDIPSEEEQMRMFSEMDDDDGWNTVQKGGKAKKKNIVKAEDTDDKLSTSDDNANGNGNGNGHVNGKAPAERKGPAQVDTGGNSRYTDPPSPMLGKVPPKFKTTKDQVDPKIWNRSNIHNHPEYDSQYPYALTGHPEDSDWAVV